MKILMVLFGSYPPDPRVRKEAKTLIQAGHEVRILCSKNDQNTEIIEGAEVTGFSRRATDVTLSKEGVNKAYTILIKGTNPDVQQAIQKEVKENSINVVHVHDLPPAKSVFAATDVPVVLDLHENYQAAIRQYRAEKKESIISRVTSNPKSGIYRLFKPPMRYERDQRIAMERADHVLAVVEEAKEVYKDSGISEEKITVVSNTVDIDWFDQHSAEYEKYESSDYLITYSGGLNGHHRGLDTAVKSQVTTVSKLPEAKLRMAGGGSLEPQLKKLASNLGIRKNVDFTGWVESTNLPKYIRAGDVGIVPHRSNPHTNTTVPHKLFHYMASGIPVLVTETDAVARIVRETECGIVVPPNDSTAFANKAIELANPARRADLGKQGQKAVEQKYNWEQDSKRLLEVYENL